MCTGRGGTPPIAFSRTKSKMKRRSERADSYYFCDASFWNHISESSQSHPAEKTDQFSLNHSPRILWVENCSDVYFPSSSKGEYSNVNSPRCCCLLCWGGVVSAANRQGIQGRKLMLGQNIKAPQYGKSKSVLFYRIIRFRGLYDISVEILFASQHFSHNQKSYPQIKNIPSKPLPISRAYFIL